MIYRYLESVLPERELGPGGQRVGNAFRIADLGCAALLASLISPDHRDTSLPPPAAIEAFLSRFASHPGSTWVRGQYRKHRSAPCVVSD